MMDCTNNIKVPGQMLEVSILLSPYTVLIN